METTISNQKNTYNQQIEGFQICIIFFLISAIFGWLILPYGFSFTDEGYHMTEAWRLTVGDNFFKDKFTGGLRTYIFLNAFIFRVYPDITLLGFRELQYCLTIVSLVIFSFALFLVSKQFWFQPLIFSIFAFTGLDPLGSSLHFNYYTYPHLFITLYLAFFLIGLKSRSQILKVLFYILSGISLWIISFSLLHLSPIALSPVLLFLIFKALKIESLKFSLKDLCFVLAPFLLFWVIFISIFNKPYIQNVFTTIQLMLSTTTHSASGLSHINWEAVKHIIVTTVFVLVCLCCAKYLKRLLFLSSLCALSIVMYVIIETSFWGLIRPYWLGWVARPIWFTALLVSSYTILSYYFISKVIYKKQWKENELYALILIIPCIIMSVIGSLFSVFGVLFVLFTSIPAVAAITCMILSLENIEKISLTEKWIILLLFLAPFYYTTEWADWNGRLSPKLYNDVEITQGFGRGIKTNKIFNNLYTWIRMTSEKYSQKDDYIISYVCSPMVHMIAKRRPSLDDTYIELGVVPNDYFNKAIDFMKNHRREPRLAFIFEAAPNLSPVPWKKDQKEVLYSWWSKQFSFPSSDPISKYVIKNMVPIDNFIISQDLVVRCYIIAPANKHADLSTAKATQ